MARGRRTSPTKTTTPLTTATRSRVRSARGMLADGVFWEMLAITSHLEEISFGLSQMLGITVQQWMVLMAVQHLDQGGGVSVSGVSARLCNDPSIVTAQSKGLEKLGWIRRYASETDARVVLMSVTTKAVDEIARVRSSRDRVKALIFDNFDDDALTSFQTTLRDLSERCRRAERQIFAELSP
jgi:DNA-binding MarR family transcriptional regulator